MVYRYNNGIVIPNDNDGSSTHSFKTFMAYSGIFVQEQVDVLKTVRSFSDDLPVHMLYGHMLLLHGNHGTGKSHLGIVAINAAKANGFSASRQHGSQDLRRRRMEG